MPTLLRALRVCKWAQVYTFYTGAPGAAAGAAAGAEDALWRQVGWCRSIIGLFGSGVLLLDEVDTSSLRLFKT